MNIVMCLLLSAGVTLHHGDLTDGLCLVKLLDRIRPTEIYNLGAQSHVGVRNVWNQFMHFNIPFLPRSPSS